MRVSLGAIILIGSVALGGCANKGLRQLSASGPGPDEFMILPSKPLTAPKDYDVLPAPTPGGSNLTDQNPTGDAIVALGGRVPSAEATGVPSSDGALVAQASRYGVPANTRTSLAEADAQFRKRQARWSSVRLFKVDRYEQAYRRETLDPHSETGKFRQSGFGTPSSPPRND
jgi:hypothetical protein